MVDALAAFVADVAFYIASRVVQRTRYQHIAARCQEAAEGRTDDYDREVAHAAVISVVSCNRVVEIDKVVSGVVDKTYQD